MLIVFHLNIYNYEKIFDNYIYIVMFISCDIRDYNYKVNCVYDVVYNDTTIRYDTIFNCSTTVHRSTEPLEVSTYSNKGTNYIYILPGCNYKQFTTAQIRIVSYKKIEE